MNGPLEQRPPEFLRCAVAGVTLSLRALPSLHTGLGSLKTRMTEFLASGPFDLQLNILMPSEEIENGQGTGEGTFPAREILGTLPGRMRGNDLAARMAANLGYLSGDPLLGSWGRRILLCGTRVSTIPLSEGVLFADMKRGEAFLFLYDPQGADPFPWWVRVNRTALNGVMAFLALYLAERKGVLAHGVGVTREGEGYLFLAPSKGGKTTLSAQSPPRSVLADDGVVLRETPGGVYLHATPFRQRPGGRIERWEWRKRPVPLKALFVLDRGVKADVVPIPRPEVVGLLTGSLTHFYLWMDPGRSLDVFDFWRRITRALPAARLAWNPERDFWPAVHHFLDRGEKAHVFEEEKRNLAQGL
jgi:hypothetical protein